MEPAPHALGLTGPEAPAPNRRSPRILALLLQGFSNLWLIFFP